MPHKGSADKRLTRNPRVLEQRDMKLVDYRDIVAAAQDPGLDMDPADTAILLSRDGELFELNMIAALIWEQLSAEHTVEHLAALVTEHFDIDPKTAASDVVALLTHLEDMGLVEPAP